MVPDDDPSTCRDPQLDSMIDELSVMRNLYYLNDNQERPMIYHSNVGAVTHKQMTYSCVGVGPSAQVVVDLIDFCSGSKARSLIYFKAIP